METILFINTKNSKTNEQHKFVLDLSNRLDLKSSNKHVALRSYLLHAEKYKKTVKNNKLKIIALTWNDEFELLDGPYSVSETQDYIEYLTEKSESLSTNPSIHISINNRVLEKIDGYKLKKKWR